jgi:serine/threonine protein kinase
VLLEDEIRKAHARDDERHRTKIVGLLKRFVELCQVVDYAHSRQVVHRDIKPSNVLLGQFGETILLDWGIAVVTEMDSHNVSSIDITDGFGPAGTPLYMSPEQASGKGHVDRLMDIYGLGGTLFTILTNEVAILGDDVMEVLGNLMQGNIRRPRQLLGRVSRELDAICSKAMEFNPERRYRSAAELATDVEGCIEGQSVFTYPGGRVWRYFRSLYGS